MHSKRLIASFAAVIALLAVAGVLELLLLAFPASDGADGGEVAVAGAETAEAALPDSAEEPRAVPFYENPVLGEVGEAVGARVAAAAEFERAVTELVESGSIVLDGKSLRQADAELLVEGAAPFTVDVGHIDQRPILPSGCEVVALAVALQAEGYDADPVEIAEGNLETGDDFTVEYVGSPRKSGGGFPACIADAGNSWLSDNGKPGRAFDLTGTEFDGVAALVELGYPVIAWTTENMVAPVARGEVVDGLQWYNPEHCVVVYGFEDDKVLVSDSLAGLVGRNRADFEHIYEKCGNLAVLVVPSAESPSPSLG